MPASVPCRVEARSKPIEIRAGTTRSGPRAAPEKLRARRSPFLAFVFEGGVELLDVGEGADDGR